MKENEPLKMISGRPYLKSRFPGDGACHHGAGDFDTPRALTLFTLFAVSAFLFGSAGYLALHAVMPRGCVFDGPYRMILYHESHPFQYVAVIALTYAIIATACASVGLSSRFRCHTTSSD